MKKCPLVKIITCKSSPLLATHPATPLLRADLMDNDYIPVLMSFQPPWNAELAEWKAKRDSMARLVSVVT